MAPQVNNQYLTFNDGNKIPAVGLGTYKATEPGSAYNSAKVALANGYRHIDTAARYGNEEEVGKAIKESGIPREEIFVTTKLWNADHDNAEAALDLSLKKLGLDYVNLYLVHWPVGNADLTKPAQPQDYTYIEVYKQLQDFVKQGKVKSIGVSNLTKLRVQALLADEGVYIKPVVNQIEAHPLLPQPDLKEYLDQENILIEAYSPLGSAQSPLFKNDTIVSLAKKNNVEPAQILVSWALQRNTVVLPKSVTEARVISNIKTIDLSEEDFDTLNKLSQKDGVVRTCNPKANVFVE